MIELCSLCDNIAEYVCLDCYKDMNEDYKLCKGCMKYHKEESNYDNKIEIVKLDNFTY